MREKSELECNCMLTPTPKPCVCVSEEMCPFPQCHPTVSWHGVKSSEQPCSVKSFLRSWLWPVVCMKVSYFAQLRLLLTADGFNQQFLLTIIHACAKVSFLETLARVLTVTSQADCRTLTLSYIVLLLRHPIRNLGRSFNNPCKCSVWL